MNPTFLGVIGPAFLNPVPTLDRFRDGPDLRSLRCLQQLYTLLVGKTSLEKTAKSRTRGHSHNGKPKGLIVA